MLKLTVEIEATTWGAMSQFLIEIERRIEGRHDIAMVSDVDGRFSYTVSGDDEGDDEGAE